MSYFCNSIVVIFQRCFRSLKLHQDRVESYVICCGGAADVSLLADGLFLQFGFQVQIANQSVQVIGMQTKGLSGSRTAAVCLLDRLQDQLFL
jgi:hypothetical protein